jgi:hypothetical protein
MPDGPVRVTIRHPDGSTVEFETDKPVTITAGAACHSLLADIAVPHRSERGSGRLQLTVIEGGKR